MKIVPKFYSQNEDTVNAFQPSDIEKLKPLLRQAEKLWYETWVAQGCEDRGTCCGGKGIEVWFCGKRKRTAEPTNIIRCPTGQGNLSAQASVEPALNLLKENGIPARYNDGWMD